MKPHGAALVPVAVASAALLFPAAGSPAEAPEIGALTTGWEIAERHPAISLEALGMGSERKGWAGGTGGELLHYTGSDWELSTTKAPRWVRAIDMHGPNRGWAVGGSIQSGFVLEYVDGAWREVPDLDTYILLGVSAVDDDEAWAVGDGGVILHGEAGDWSEIEAGTDESLYDIDMVNEGRGWAVGGHGIILEYAGGQWKRYPRPLDRDLVLTSVQMLSVSESWAVGTQGTILHYEDGEWIEAESPTDQNLVRVDLASPWEGWAVGGLGPVGVILRYQNGTWHRQVSPVNHMITDLDMISRTEGWAVTLEGAVLHYQGPELTPRACLPSLNTSRSAGP